MVKYHMMMARKKNNVEKVNKNNKNSKVKSAKNGKVLNFFKRFWYWFVAMPVLAGAIIGWCFAMGYLGNGSSVGNYETINISMLSGSYYYLYPQENENVIIRSQDKELIEYTDTGMLYAKDEGTAVVVVAKGSEPIKTYYVEISVMRKEWTLKSYERYDEAALFGNLDCFYEETQKSISFSDITIMDRGTTDEDYGCIITKSPGLCSVEIGYGSVVVCSIIVNVENDAEDDIDVDFFVLTDEVSQKINKEGKKKIRKEYAVSVGERQAFEDFAFSSEGCIYFISSNTGVVRAYINGGFETFFPGESLVSVLCVNDDGYDFYTYKVTVSVYEKEFTFTSSSGESQNVKVGQTFTESELFSGQYIKTILLFETSSENILSISQTDNGYEFTALRKTEEGRYVTIYGYGFSGTTKVLVAKFTVAIDPATE